VLFSLSGIPPGDLSAFCPLRLPEILAQFREKSKNDGKTINLSMCYKIAEKIVQLERTEKSKRIRP
jgi:hypothetical protein